jgi:hypothetical protein
MSKRLWMAMVVLCACARLVPHPWNFTPLIALALFSGSQARRLGTGVLVTLASLALGDAVMGFYQGFWYVYGAALIPVLLGKLIGQRANARSIGLAAVASSLSFFVITNFMVWARGNLYPHSASGLTTCFAAAIPFYRNQLLGDAFYTIALFGGYALIRSRLEPARQAA